MNKKILISILFVSTIILSFFYFYNRTEKKIDNIVKKISNNSKNLLSLKIETIDYNKNRGFIHYTNTDNILFSDNELGIKITKGGIVKKSINRFYNPNLFKKITKIDDKIFIGYKNGFLVLSKENINFFDLSIDIKKCIKANSIYCISDKKLIYSKNNLRKFFFKKEYKKIKDIVYYSNKILLLLDKNIIIIGKDKQKRIKLNNNFNKFIRTSKNLYLSGDREIYKFKDEKLSFFKKITGIDNIIEIDNIFYYISFDGIIYKENKKIVKIDSIINNSFLFQEKIILLTPNGTLKVKNDKLLDSVKKNSILQQNYITKLYKHKDELYIGFFNKGVSSYNLITNSIKSFVKNLNGINDIKVIKNSIYIATTNALEVFDLSGNKLDSFSKKDGLLGRNVSSMEVLKDKLYLGTEGGVSKKTDHSFISIYGLNGLVNNRVNCLKKYKDNLYVGTLGGISKLNDLKVIKNFGVENFKSIWITALTTLNDKLFIGTYGAGLYFYDGKNITHISKKRVFVNPNAIIGYKNFIFVGTLNKGIFVYDIKNKKGYFYDEISSLNITAFHIEKNKLFVGSDFGFWIIPLELINQNLVR